MSWWKVSPATPVEWCHGKKPPSQFCCARTVLHQTQPSISASPEWCHAETAPPAAPAFFPPFPLNLPLSSSTYLSMTTTSPNMKSAVVPHHSSLILFPSLFPAVWSHYRPSTLSNWFPLSFSYSPLSLPPSLPCCEQSIVVISGCSPLSAFSLLLRFFSTFFSFSILNTFVPPAHPSEHTLTHTHRSSTSLSGFQHDTEGLTLTNFLLWLDFSLFFGEQVWNVFRTGRLLPTSSHCVYKMAAWGRRGGVTEWCLCSSLSGDTHACSHPLTQWVSLQCSAFLRRTRPWQPFWGRAGRDQYSTVIYSTHVVIHTNSPNHIQQQYTDNNFGFSTI